MRYTRALLDRFNDDAEFCRDSLCVLDKHGQLVAMEQNQAQKVLSKKIKEIRAKGNPVRLVILKSRRAGFSTGVAARLFRETPFRSGQKTVVVAQDAKAVKESLFPMYDRFQQYYRPFGATDDFGGIALPELISDRQDGIEWENQSSILIQTAKNLEGSRSFGFRRIHLSEFAFYPNAKKLMTALMQTVPDDPDTFVVVESTANGMGGPFYELWMEASAQKKKSIWEPLFFPFWMDPDCWRALDVPPDRFQQSMTDAEHRLMQLYSLHLEVINWRRWAIANKCGGDDGIFDQEYPHNPRVAFLLTGRPRFTIANIEKQTEVAGTVGELDQEQVGTRVELIFRPRPQGALTIWKKPSRLRQYIIGADTSGGIDINEGEGTPDPDFSVGQVFEREMREQVAMLRERIAPAAFGDYLFDLGKWYNWAFIVPEVNAEGLSTVDRLEILGYPPERIYKRRRTDETGNPVTNLVGWKTTAITRPQLISHLDRAINEGDIIIYDETTLQELRTFVYKPNGKPEAAKDCHDDCVFAAALAVVGLIEAPIFRDDTKTRASAARRYAPTMRERISHSRYGEQRKDDGWDD